MHTWCSEPNMPLFPLWQQSHERWEVTNFLNKSIVQPFIQLICVRHQTCDRSRSRDKAVNMLIVLVFVGFHSRGLGRWKCYANKQTNNNKSQTGQKGINRAGKWRPPCFSFNTHVNVVKKLRLGKCVLV